MRAAVTFFELLIVIVVIAVIAAIAIPGLVESRTAAQEQAACAVLKSVLFPAQVQFQAAGHADLDGDKIGTFAVDGIVDATTNPYDVLCGDTPIHGEKLSLITSKLGSKAPYGHASATGQALTAVWPTLNGYVFKTPISAVAPGAKPGSDGTAETTWAILCFPVSIEEGHRFFMIDQAGIVFASIAKPTVAADGLAASTTDAAAFGADLTGTPTKQAFWPAKH